MSSLNWALVAEIPAWLKVTLHVGACVLVPLAWGVATELVFRRIEKCRSETKPDDPPRAFINRPL